MINMNSVASAVNTYTAYSKKTENRNSKTEKNANEIKQDKTESSKNVTKTPLSSKAQKMLDTIKEKYRDMDIFVADFSDENEAKEIMSRGTKEFSVLFTPEELEKMANDEKYAQEKMNGIDEAVRMSKEINQKFGFESAFGKQGDSSVVTKFGISINNDGTMTYFAALEEMTQNQKERIKESLEKKTEQKEEDAKLEKEKEKKVKTTTVQASSFEELLKKIEDTDWTKVPETEKEKTQGLKMDFTI